MSSGLFQLLCHHCGHEELSDVGNMVMRLRTLGLMRRGDPDPELVAELFKSARARFTCTNCGRVGLSGGAADMQTLRRESRFRPALVDATRNDATEQEGVAWPGDTVLCPQCRQQIPSERLELFPRAKLCAGCQMLEDNAEADPDFCPRCGDLLRIQHKGGSGLTRYEARCGACGYRA